MKRLPRTIMLAAIPALVAIALPSPAMAGKPGKWTRFSPETGRNIYQAGLARTSDGTLHALWKEDENSGKTTMKHTAVSASGNILSTTTVQSGWQSMQNAALVTGPDGTSLHAFWGGILSTSPGSTLTGIAYATTGDGGSSWALDPTPVVEGGNAYAGDTGAARLGGTFFESWMSNYHRGLSKAEPSHELSAHPNAFKCCGYNGNLAANEGTGTVVIAWFSNQDGYPGVWAQAVDPATGNPTGSMLRMPGSWTTYNGQAQSSQQLSRTPIVSRMGGPGIYVAYPTGYPTTKQLRVWAFGASKSTVVGKSAKRLSDGGVAAVPGGRIWAFWASGNKVFARRSNTAVTKWGATVQAKRPKAAGDTWQLDGDAQSGVLDLVASFGTSGGIANWHTQVRPALSLNAKPSKIQGGDLTKVKFTVTDAGDPVKGATVKADGESGKTNAKGIATLELGPFPTKVKKVSATAKKAGYTSAGTVVKVK